MPSFTLLRNGRKTFFFCMGFLGVRW